MSNTEYLKLKLELVNKLAKYIAEQPELLKKYSGYSYVIYTTSKEFNKKNSNLIKSLKEENKKIVKATFIDQSNDWSFAPLS
ncbi:hypothetical protein IPM65_06410 [Candidatus Roizmanbacteria bacterium]|nr:MAG: hypothetical protein IPM65_06410 [Candidatus Roizmanbacteria bacterium]